MVKVAHRAFASLNIASKPNRFTGQVNNGKYQKNFQPIGSNGAIRLSEVIRLLFL